MASRNKSAPKKPRLRGTEPQLPHWLPLVFVPIGITLLLLSLFLPTAIPYGYLGPLGVFIKYLIVHQPNILIGLMWFSTICHVGEAGYVLFLCRREKVNLSHTLQWFFLVLLYGIFCLRYFKPIREKKN